MLYTWQRAAARAIIVRARGGERVPPVSEAKRASNDRWDRDNMAYQTVKVSKALLQEFRVTVAQQGDKVNTVLRQAMEDYIEKHKERPSE